MPMRATTVRFGEDLWALLEREAAEQGVSAAQFVRDAAILRLAHLAADRDAPEARLSIEEIASGALRETRGGPLDTVLAAVRDPDAPRRPARDRRARRPAAARRSTGIANVAARVLTRRWRS